MRKYRKYNWPALLKAFDASGLTQAKFCEENAISPNYFSQKRAAILASTLSRFEKIEVQPEEPPRSLVLQVGRCRIECPESMPLESFTALVHQLS